MGLIQRIIDGIEIRKESRLILQELARGRVYAKRAERAQQKELDKMLKMRFATESIIKLQNMYGETEYFQVKNIDVATLLSFIAEGVTNFSGQFKQLTGVYAGEIFTINNSSASDYALGFIYVKGKLLFSVNGYQIGDIGNSIDEWEELKKKHGKTITLKKLLELRKIDNDMEDVIDVAEEYDVVKQLYDSEDILIEGKKELIRKGEIYGKRN